MSQDYNNVYICPKIYKKGASQCGGQVVENPVATGYICTKCFAYFRIENGTPFTTVHQELRQWAGNYAQAENTKNKTS
jgi:hypothetical protein